MLHIVTEALLVTVLDMSVSVYTDFVGVPQL